MNSPRGTRKSGPVQIWEDQNDVRLDEAGSTTSDHLSDHLGPDENDAHHFDSDEQTDVDADVAESIEGPNYRWKISFERKQYPKDQRHLSTTTAIHLDDDEDPFVEEEDHGGYNDGEGDEPEQRSDVEEIYEQGSQADEYDPRSRIVSGTPTNFSELPDELDVSMADAVRSQSYRSPSTHSTPTRALRQQFPRDRLLSSPTHQGGSIRQFSRSSTTPNSQQSRYVSSPLAQRKSASGFRNPSSVRAMQLSSPSPPPGLSPRFAQSPRSARQRRMEMEERSRSSTPLQHDNPKKEYPLVLLHCSFTPLLPPYTNAVLDTVLPLWIQENLAMLHDKVTPTVVERGVLIPHPGEDYELLEERILESLELKKPRVGKCGHFNALESETDTQMSAPESLAALEDVDGFDKEAHMHDNCSVCGRDVASSHRGCAGDAPHRRWDIRVYAANGLMRAGAWSAAWREMEKVDLEIGVWIPEGIRKALDEEAMKRIKQQDDGETWARDAISHHKEYDDAFGPQVQVSRAMPTAPTPPRLAQQKMESASASTAACTKPNGLARERRSRARPATHEQVPLSSLFANYLAHLMRPTRELLLQSLVVVLGVVVLWQWSSPVKLATPLPHDLSIALEAVKENISQAVPQLSSEGNSFENLETASATVDSDAPVALSACTFALGEAHERGYTAIPSAVAQSVLDVVSSGHLRASTEAETLTTLPTAHSAEETPVEDLSFEPDSSQADFGSVSERAFAVAGGGFSTEDDIVLD